jgi:hypothetical protein
MLVRNPPYGVFVLPFFHFMLYTYNSGTNYRQFELFLHITFVKLMVSQIYGGVRLILTPVEGFLESIL